MSFLFGGERPPEPNKLKQYSREIHRHCMHMERESGMLQAKEKGIIKEIFKYASKNELHMAKLKAKELIRNRQVCKRIQITQHGLTSLSQQLSMMESSQKSNEVLAKASKILQALNSKMDLKQTYHMLQEFEKETQVMNEKQELINEGLDNVFETDEQDIDQTLQSVFEELGLQATLDLSKTGKVGEYSSLLQVPIQDIDLEAKLARLKAQKGFSQ